MRSSRGGSSRELLYAECPSAGGVPTVVGGVTLARMFKPTALYFQARPRRRSFTRRHHTACAVTVLRVLRTPVHPHACRHPSNY